MADTDQSISWAHPIGTRDGTLTKDARMINAYVEQTENGNALVKRPGTAYVNQSGFVPGIPQGLFNVVSSFSIVGDIIYSLTDGAQSPIPIPSVPIPGRPYDHLDNVPLNQSTSWLKNFDGLWKFTSSVTKVTDPNYPVTTVRGLAFLDGVFYVMDLNGKVYGSAINDGTVWPALDFVQAEYIYGAGAAIHRHLNYIVAFYQFGIQIYYDANSAPNGQGIALGAVPNAAWTTGSIINVEPVEIYDVTYFVSQSLQYGRGVHTLQGLNLVKVSTPFVDKILNLENLAGQAPFAFGIRIAGKSFYVLTLPNTNVTLAYDIDGQVWNQWSSIVGSVERSFVGRYYLSGIFLSNTNTLVGDFLQDVTTGKTMFVSNQTYVDATGPLQVTSYTPPMDFGSINWKRFAYMYQLADTVNTTVSVSFSDNDYQTFSTPRIVDMSTVRKQMRNCGSSRRRSWKLVHSDNTPLRIFEMKANTDGMQR